MRNLLSAPIEPAVNPFDPILDGLAVATDEYGRLRQMLNVLEGDVRQAEDLLNSQLNPETPIDRQPASIAEAALTVAVTHLRMQPLYDQQGELRFERRYTKYAEFIGKKVLVESLDDVKRIGTSNSDGQGLGIWYTSRRGTVKDLDFGPEYGGSITVASEWRNRRYTAAPLVGRSTIIDPYAPLVRITLL